MKKLYSKRGDTGKTQTLRQRNIEKSHPLIELEGQLDELIAILGLAKLYASSRVIGEELEHVQRCVSKVIAVVSGDDTKFFASWRAELERLEQRIDELQEQFADRLTDFVVPGSSKAEAYLNLCRVVCRRAERWAVRALKEGSQVHELVVTYLNRLSDFLFALSVHVSKLKE